MKFRSHPLPPAPCSLPPAEEPAPGQAPGRTCASWSHWGSNLTPSNCSGHPPSLAPHLFSTDPGFTLAPLSVLSFLFCKWDQPGLGQVQPPQRSSGRAEQVEMDAAAPGIVPGNGRRPISACLRED